jgi:hypothetical protein
MTEANEILDECYRGLSAESLAMLFAERETTPTEILLEGNPIGDAGAHFLAKWRGIAQVRVLNLADTGIGPAGLAALLATQAQPIALYLDENPLYDEGIQLLARSSFASKVRHLGLSCTGLDTAGVMALTESPHLGAVETLDLTQTELAEEDWQSLRARFPRVIGA